MCKIKLTLDKIFNEVDRAEFASLKGRMEQCNQMLHDKTGAGSDFLGWVDLPAQITENDLLKIEAAAQGIRKKAEVIIVIGIGGSYLGAKAILDGLSSNFDWLDRRRENPIVVFEGQNISEYYIHELLETMQHYSIAAVCVSKSGTTTETAIAFRIIRDEIERRYGKGGAAERIVTITSENEGALRKMSDQEGYVSFPIPEDVGGRYSIFSPVGLVPLAMAGIDIRALLNGAKRMREVTAADVPFEQNIAAQYAAARYLLYTKAHKKIEILACFLPKLQSIAEWWKQLFGESEGKDGKGLFPASVVYTTDLHSLGQYIQSGERILFETVLTINEYEHPMYIKRDEQNLDKMNYLVGRRISEVNKMAEIGTMMAHVDGGVPNIRIEMERVDEYCIGELFYFFEKACGISGYALGVNPFDQPGVEDYKRNLFALLDKPGYEKEREELMKRM